MPKQIELPALTVTPRVMVSELRRELMMRARVYPRWVALNKLSQSDMDHRVRVLNEVLALVEAVFADELRPAQEDMLQ